MASFNTKLSPIINNCLNRDSLLTSSFQSDSSMNFSDTNLTTSNVVLSPAFKYSNE